MNSEGFRAQVAMDTILRADIKEMVGRGLSLMPDGFEAASNHQEMSDLASRCFRWTGSSPGGERE